MLSLGDRVRLTKLSITNQPHNFLLTTRGIASISTLHHTIQHAPLRPLVRLNSQMRLHEPPPQRKVQTQSMFTDSGCTCTRGIADSNTSPSTSRNVNTVNPRGGIADQFELWRGLDRQEFGVELQCDSHNDSGVADSRKNLVLACLAVSFDLVRAWLDVEREREVDEIGFQYHDD
jgi:hypothetical protein